MAQMCICHGTNSHILMPSPFYGTNLTKYDIILLRNIAHKEGLCNGTRLILRDMHHNVLDANW